MSKALYEIDFIILSNNIYTYIYKTHHVGIRAPIFGTSCPDSRHFLLNLARGIASDLFVDALLEGQTSIGLGVGLMDHLNLLTASVPLIIDIITDIGHLPPRVNRKDGDFHFHLVIMAGKKIDVVTWAQWISEVRS